TYVLLIVSTEARAGAGARRNSVDDRRQPLLPWAAANDVLNAASHLPREPRRVARDRPHRLVLLHPLDAAHRIEDGGQAEAGLVAARLLTHPVLEGGELDAAQHDPRRRELQEQAPDLLLGGLEVEDDGIALAQAQRGGRRGILPPP